MSSQRFNFRAAVYLVLIDKDKVLLSRRFNTGWMDGMYSLPAGHVDGNETLQMAMSREAKEELDLSILPEDLSILHMMHKKSDYEYFDFFLEVKKYSGLLKNNEENKCDELKFFPLDSLPENTLEYIKIALGQIAKGDKFSSFGFSPTKLF
jgi:ADP-ribose pyrophosphatase YjhB (NUDIX family)